MPGVSTVIPTQGAKVKRGRTHGHKGGEIGASRAGNSGKISPDVAPDLLRQLLYPVAKILVGMQESLPGNIDHPAGTVVLVKQSLHVFNDLRVVLDKRSAPIQPLFLASPMPGKDCPFWIGINLL